MTDLTATPPTRELVLPERPGQAVTWGNTRDAGLGLPLSMACELHKGLMLVVTADTPSAVRLEAELGFFAPELPVLVFPDWETLPYDVFSPHQDIISTRLTTLFRLQDRHYGVLIVPAATLMQRLSPRAWLYGHCVLLKPGDRLDLASFRARLEASGHRCVSQVREHGEFAVRGSLLDLYPMGSEMPYRLDMFDDEIESIRLFDPESQLSSGQVESINLLPAREFPADEAAVARFRSRFRQQFPGDPKRSPVYEGVSAGLMPGGIEYYLPLFFDQTESLFDYLPTDTLLVTDAGIHEAVDSFWAQTGERYEQLRHDLNRPLLAPEDLFLAWSGVDRRCAGLARIETRAETVKPSPTAMNLDAADCPPVEIHHRAEDPAAALTAFRAAFPGRTLFVAESAGRREILLQTLRNLDITAKPVAGWRAFLDEQTDPCITVAPLERGMLLPGLATAVITEGQLEQERALRTRRRGSRRDLDSVVSNLTELAIGAPVVHEDHGVGRYRGLQIIETEGCPSEYLILEYLGGDKLYVPVAALQLIGRYTGGADNAPWHRLGNDHWQKAKRKAAEQARDAAAELLDIYARRQAKPGHAFSIDTHDYRAFAEAFPFEETPDQQTAIETTLTDMAAPRPMDRVVCGDVGFGKTEVAMRACFVAVQAGRQVALLVPTTLLAQQHYQNFIDRFADWPVNIEVLSRFRSKKQQDALLQHLQQGRVDVVIGTHKLLQETVRFKNLGLIVVDEEHRFGVRHKERLKALRSEVDVLTLTATPIPRTLNMALSGLRDLSIIATPPSDRLAVKTFVGEWNKAVVQEACMRELKRGGQVYVLHNDVDTIERKAREIEEIVPGARVAVAHGQMRERLLEPVMLDFYHQRCNILVCTTIIESGIDVPNANTIIIERADRLGLAQLHQLRGRVGRSHHRAYAYLMVPHRKAMTPDAIKRIEAIEAMEDLGAGFVLATHDLEIRGAGELLGEGQSGQIQEIGFGMYSELLERAVAALKSGKQPELEKPLHQGTEIDIQAPALLPDSYLPDVHTRLIMYKRIANADDLEGLRDLQVEMIDRFGLLPEPAKTLFRVTALKLKTGTVGVRRIEAGPDGGRILFTEDPNINFNSVMRLIQERSSIYRLDGRDRLRFTLPLPDAESRIKTLDQLLTDIAA